MLFPTARGPSTRQGGGTCVARRAEARPVPLGLVFGALPFLPPGRGALILILGGLFVLPLSLLLSRMGVRTPRRAPLAAPMAFIPVAPPASAAPRAPHLGRAPTHAPEGRPWGGTGIERALRQAVGATRLLAAAPGHYVIQLSRCDSCRHREPCEPERAAIAAAVAAYLKDPHVHEVACAQRSRRGACTFDIRGR